MNNQNDQFIESYIHAVARQLPHKMRADIKKELRGLIDDMLETRCGDKPITEKDIRIVIIELGTPNELAIKYNVNSKNALISGEYYHLYVQVLKIVGICFLFGLLVGLLVSFFLNGDTKPVYILLRRFLAILLIGPVHAFAFITFIFAVMEYKGVKIDDNKGYMLNPLPEAPSKKDKITPLSCFIGIGFSALFLILFLTGAIQYLPFVFINGEPLEWLNMELIHGSWYLFVMLFVLGVARDISKLIDGRHSLRVMIVTVSTDILSMIVVFFAFASAKFINIDNIKTFLLRLTGAANQDINVLVGFFEKFAYFFAFIYIVALVIDIATTVYYYFKYK